MSKRVLHVVQRAFRATLEEQDDTVLWLAQALKGAGAEPAVLLRGTAVAYLATGQDASGLAFGARRQTQPPALREDLQRMVRNGIPVFYVSEDQVALGLAGQSLPGASPVGRPELPSLFARFDQVWFW
jgi:hypothetical protein